MGLCSSSETKTTKTTTATQNPVNPVGAGTSNNNNNTRSDDPASAPAHIENPEGVTILDHSTAHLENNENDGGALEVYLDDDVPGDGYQQRDGQAAVPTKRRPSMIIPLDAAFPPVMNPDEVVCGAKIGSGSFGVVVHAHYQGFHVAVKKCYVPKKRSEFKEVFDDFVREVTLLQSLTHARILRYVGKVQDRKTKRLWIATEVMAGSVSTLLQMIKNSGGSHMLSWRLILQIMADAAEGMTFLHETDIIHRDLKAENLLLDEDFRCKLADFGLARTIDKGGTMTICGTPSWIAPEVFQGSHYDKTVDVYSFSIVMWELVCMDKPYKGIRGQQIARKVVVEGVRPNVPTHVPNALQDIMPRMWASDAKGRPHFPEIEAAIKLAMTQINLDAGVDVNKPFVAK